MPGILLTVKEVAEILGVSVPTVYRKEKRGSIPRRLTGKFEKAYWNREDVESCLRQCWKQKDEAPETPAMKKWREALADAECARWGI